MNDCMNRALLVYIETMEDDLRKALAFHILHRRRQRLCRTHFASLAGAASLGTRLSTMPMNVSLDLTLWTRLEVTSAFGTTLLVCLYLRGRECSNHEQSQGTQRSIHVSVSYYIITSPLKWHRRDYLTFLY